MKRTIYSIMLAALLLLPQMQFGVQAQNNRGQLDDFGRIALTAYIPEDSPLPAEAKRVLVNKLTQIATKNGLANASFDSRFVFTARVAETASEVTSTTPQMWVKHLDIYFYVGDGIDGNLYSSTVVSTKGVGDTETKAYMAALKALSVNNPAFKPMLDKGKNRIIEYYNTNCDFILTNAFTLASVGEYGAAMLELAAVPDICKECYERCMDELSELYLEQLDLDCRQKLAAAQAIWGSQQNEEAAVQASGILALIDPRSPSYADAETLQKEIHDYVYDKSHSEMFEQILAQLEELNGKVEMQKQTPMPIVESAKQEALQEIEQMKHQPENNSQPTTNSVASKSQTKANNAEKKSTNNNKKAKSAKETENAPAGSVKRFIEYSDDWYN